MGWKHSAAVAMHRSGLLRVAGSAIWGPRLTVLAYHRVIDPDSGGFAGFRGNVSARPEEFDRQMAWVASRFDPVSLADVAGFARGGELPARPLLVTFDDGYLDNLDNALPILQRHGLPWAIFLATGHIDTGDTFWWDRVAGGFTVVGAGEADLPLLGPRRWESAHEIATEWIAAAKREPDRAKVAAVERLGEVLGSTGGTVPRTTLDWEQVRALAAAGVEIGAHTLRHPILTRVPPETARREIFESAARVAAEVGSRPLGFAYPNGRPGDFDEMSRKAVAEAGIPVAFTLVPGPMRRSELRAKPLAIRRIYVHHGDDVAGLAAKAAGIPRLAGLQ